MPSQTNEQKKEEFRKEMKRFKNDVIAHNFFATPFKCITFLLLCVRVCVRDRKAILALEFSWNLVAK